MNKKYLIYYCKKENCNNRISYRTVRCGSGNCAHCAQAGHKVSKETRMKISNGNKGKIFTKEHKEKLRIASTGRKHSKETCKKIGLIHKDKITSLETKNKISEARKGKRYPKLSLALKGRKPNNKGIPMSDEQKIKLSKIRIEKRLSKGKNNPNYKGGITSLHLLIRVTKKYELWRIGILNKDNYICQDCGINNNQLEVHHKKSFSELLQLFLKKI